MIGGRLPTFDSLRETSCKYNEQEFNKREKNKSWLFWNGKR